MKSLSKRMGHDFSKYTFDYIQKKFPFFICSMDIVLDETRSKILKTTRSFHPKTRPVASHLSRFKLLSVSINVEDDQNYMVDDYFYYGNTAKLGRFAW